MKFTLVSTIFNEAKRLEQTIQDLNSQTLQPSEIIITDAGSNDQTIEILENWQRVSKVPITIIIKKGCNVAEGRNIAIRAANYDLIASTDFGCRFHPQWLESLMEPFSNPEVLIVGGSYTSNEQEQVTLAAKAAYLIAKGYNTNVYQPGFIPSSRSIAYNISVFKAVGGYNEWLTLAADDTLFGLEVKAKGFNIHNVDKQHVYWGRHKTAAAFSKEAARYGLGEGEARINAKVMIVNILTLVMQAGFLITTIVVLSGLASLSLPILVWYLACCLSLKSFMAIFVFWLGRRSAKYNGLVLLYAFYLLTRIRYSYIRSWFTGYFFSSNEQKRQAAFLAQRLR